MTIRVGVMCAGRTFPRWQAQALRSLLEVPDVEIALLIVKEGDRSGRLGALLSDWRHLLWNIFEKVYVARRSLASRPVDMTEELDGVSELKCKTVKIGRAGEALSDADIESVRAARLDLIVRFGFGILKGAILDAARLGVWSYHHGDEREYRGRPPAFWEMRDRRPTVGAMIQVLTERLDAGSVLQRGTFRVVPHSYNRTRDAVLLGSVDLLHRALRAVENGDVIPPPSVTSAPVLRAPSQWTMLRFLGQLARAFVVSQLSGLTRAAKWNVGTLRIPISSLLSGSPVEVSWCKEQRGSRYLADPFVDPTSRTRVALVEEYDYSTHRGVISAIDLDHDSKPFVVLDTGTHASYPYLFEHDGEIYCTPETYQAEEIRLYRCETWPSSWNKVGTLVEGIRALDPTIFQYGGRWWLFCTLEGPTSNSHLYAYHADTIDGPWESHALNPVKIDVTGSRPAGTPFELDGVWYRPAQDSSESYGGALSINRIETLSPSAFAERLVRHISPDDRRYRDGVHTLSVAGGMAVIDGRRDVLIPAALARELRGRVDRLLRLAGVRLP